MNYVLKVITKDKFYRLLRSFCSVPAMLPVILLVSCMASHPSEEKKINGISLVASREQISEKDISHIKNINAGAVALMPYAFMEKPDSPDLFFNRRQQFYGERVEGIRESVKMLHKSGIKVLLKPQIWIRQGEFTGDIKMTSDFDWRNFEKNYSEFILLYAQVAEEEKVEFFSLGTELSSFIQEQPDFWNNLISKVRKIYSGKITYAENWDKVEKVPFWNSLDFIGVDAYFPLNSTKNPSLEQLKADWQPHKSVLQQLSYSAGKPILFTEFGYRSIDFATKTPWDSSREISAVNPEEQVVALKALFQEFWDEDWFAGGFLWKWHQDYERAGGDKNNQFTVQNKPAENVVREIYSRH